MRVEVHAAHVAGVEVGLRAGHVAERRSEAPIERRGKQWPVEHVVADGGQVEDSGFGAVGGVGKGLEAVRYNGGDESIVLVGE